MDPQTSLIVACLTAGLLTAAVAFLWYGGIIFKTEEKETPNKGALIVVSFIVGAWVAYFAKWINHPDPLNPIVHGAFHGSWHLGRYIMGAALLLGITRNASPAKILQDMSFFLVALSLLGATLASFPSFTPPPPPAEEEEEETGARFDTPQELERATVAQYKEWVQKS